MSGRGQVWPGVWTLRTPWVPPRCPLVRVHPSVHQNAGRISLHAELTVPPAPGLGWPAGMCEAGGGASGWPCADRHRHRARQAGEPP